MIRQYKLKSWPNGMGWDYEDWELTKNGDIYYARHFKPGQQYPDKVGNGDNFASAILNAKVMEG